MTADAKPAAKTLEQKVDQLLSLGEKFESMEKAVAKLGEVEERKGEFSDKSNPNLNTKWPQGEHFSLANYVSAILGMKTLGFERSWGRFPYEKSVMEAAEANRKAMGEATNAAGGFLVPPQYITELIETIRARSITDVLGVRRMSVNSNTGYIPRQSGVSTAAWLGEAATIPASDLAFEQLAFTMRKLAAYAIMSNELLADSNPAIDALVRDDLAAAIALKEDSAILYGTGTAPEPRGVKNATGVTLTAAGVNGATPTFDMLIDLEANLRVNNRRATGWATAPRTTTTLRKVKDLNGNYVWQPAPYTGFVVPSQAVTAVNAPAAPGFRGVQPATPVGTILGAPYSESTQIPVNLVQGTATDATDIFVGQWDEVLVLEKGGLELAASEHILFQNYQTAIRAIVRRDVLVRHGNAFAVLIGVRP